jgi:predicted transcriptional regulator
MNVLKVFHSNRSMRRMLFILIFATLLFSQPPCPSCAELFTAYETGLVSGLVDENVDVYMYAVYNGERLPVGNATLFMEVYNATGDLYDRCRIFTDENGKAVFSVSEYKDACSGQGILRGCRIGIKFCCSSSPNCLLQPCLNESITSFEDVPPCGSIRPAPWPESAYINDSGTPVFATLSPTYAEVVYIPTLLPPLFGGTAPAICLPLFIIAGMLLVASYATGGSPFFWFDLNTLRFTTGQRARVIGKGGITISQQSVIGRLEKTEKGKEVKEKIAAPIQSRIQSAAVQAGRIPGWIASKLTEKTGGRAIVGKQPWAAGFIKGGKPALPIQKLRKLEKKLTRGKKEKEKPREVRAGPERIAIGSGQFGAKELSSAFLKSKLHFPGSSLLDFLGLSDAVVSGFASGLKGESFREQINKQLDEIQKDKDTVAVLLPITEAEKEKKVNVNEKGDVVVEQEGKTITIKNEDAARIYANLSDIYSSISSIEPEKSPLMAHYRNQGAAFEFAAYLLEHYPEVSKMNKGEGKQFITEVINQTNQGFFVLKNYDQYKYKSEGVSTLSQIEAISSLSLAWNGNILVENKTKSLGLNEKELGEVREKLVDAYLHPEKYEAERNAVSLIKYTFIKDPEKLTEEEKELQKLAEKALKGDEKAMEKIKEILEGDSQQKLANSTDLIERIKEGPHSLSNKEKQKFYVTALSPFIGTPKITKEDEILLLKALGDERLTDVESARLDELFKNNKSDILDYYQNTKKRLQRQLTIIPTLDRMLLFIYLSSPAELKQH